MIEQVMYFLLGALTAALLAMAALPALWRRAVRLTRARLEASLPLTPAEIAAEKDQLRAGFAVDLRRAEQKVENAELAVQKLKADAGTNLLAIQERDGLLQANAGRIAQLEIDLGAGRATIANLEADVATLTRERDNLGTLLASARVANENLTQEAEAARSLAEQRQQRLADIEGQFESLGVRLGENQAMVADLRDSIRQKMEELRTAARALRDASGERANMERRMLAAESIAEDRARAIEALQTERLRLIDESGVLTRQRDAERLDRVDALRDVDSLRTRIADIESAATTERAEMHATILDLSRSIEQARTERRTMIDEISSLRFTKGRLETDLIRLKKKDAEQAETLPAMIREGVPPTS